MSSFSFNQENINKLIEISKSAGKAIMDIYHSDFNIESKKDSSPLTKADILSNKIICSAVNKLDPSIPIISEESSDISFNHRSKWKDYWLVDPLDGTKEFINKNGEFTTNIAFMKNNRPIFGMIYAPVLDEIYWGSIENGSFMLKGNKFKDIEQIKVNNKSRGSLKIVKSRSHPSEDLNNLMKKLDSYELIEIGSSLKFCLVAKGDADCYPRFGPTSEWDTAAGEAIVLSAGGRVIDLENQPIKYNKGSSFINPSFIVANNKLSLDMILSSL